MMKIINLLVLRDYGCCLKRGSTADVGTTRETPREWI